MSMYKKVKCPGCNRYYEVNEDVYFCHICGEMFEDEGQIISSDNGSYGTSGTRKVNSNVVILEGSSDAKTLPKEFIKYRLSKIFMILPIPFMIFMAIWINIAEDGMSESSIYPILSCMAVFVGLSFFFAAMNVLTLCPRTAIKLNKEFENRYYDGLFGINRTTANAMTGYEKYYIILKLISCIKMIPLLICSVNMFKAASVLAEMNDLYGIEELFDIVEPIWVPLVVYLVLCLVIPKVQEKIHEKIKKK